MNTLPYVKLKRKSAKGEALSHQVINGGKLLVTKPNSL